VRIAVRDDGALELTPLDDGPPLVLRLIAREAPTRVGDVASDPGTPVPLRAENGRFVAETALPSGVRVRFAVSAVPLEGARADLAIGGTVVAGDRAGGVSQELRVSLTDTFAPAFYLPGIWIDGNPYTAAGAPSVREGADWSFRDDRLAWPAAIAWDERSARATYVLRATPATRDPRVPFTHDKRFGGAIVADAEAGDVGSMGFARTGGPPALVARLPFAELPRSYQDKRTLVPPVAGFFRERTGATWTVRYRVGVAPATDAYAALEAAAREGLAVWETTGPVAGDRSVSRIKSSIVGHVSGHFFGPRTRRGVSGFYTLVETFGDAPILPICEPAFTGKAFWHAKHFLAWSRSTGDARAGEIGAAVLDSWTARGLRKGLLVDFWARGIGKLPVDRPFTFEPPWPLLHNPTAATRRLAEAALALLDASAMRPDRPAWRSVALAQIDALAAMQAPDGGFARRYRFADRSPVETDTVGPTPSAVPALLAAHRATGDARFRDAATRAGEFLLDRMVAPVRFHGSTLDANCEDKEAATEALHALLLLHDATGDARWADAARKVAWLALAWVCLTDVPFDPGGMLGGWGVRTRGLTLVSTENNHADVYLFGTPADLRRLAALDARLPFARVAWTMLRAALQVTTTSAHRPEPYVEAGRTHAMPVGLVPEVLNQTWWVYYNRPLINRHRSWIKGFANEKTSLWTSAAVWDALDELRAVVSDDEWAEHLKP
jgi:hypothetical protein